MKSNRTVFLSLFLTLGISSIAFAGSWESGDTGWKYLKDDGNYIVSDWYQGDDGEFYYLNNDGDLAIGWHQVDGNWYYADEKGVTLKNSWLDDAYYFDADGKMVANTSIDGNRIGSDGKKMTDAISYKIENPTTVISPKIRMGGIPSGEYIFYASPDVAHVKIISGSECIVDRYNFIELHEGDTVDINGVYMPVGNMDKLDITVSGMFRVGKDIAEGTYSIMPPEDTGRVNIAICTVFNEIPSSKDEEKPENNIISEKYVTKRSGTISVTVKNGQYLQLINCTGNLVQP